MNKQEFTKILTELVSLKKDESNLNKALKKFESDFNYICFSRYENLIVKLLEIAMNDKSNWISYWIYDCNCGKDSKYGKVTDKNGKNVPIKTISDLYNLIKNPI